MKIDRSKAKKVPAEPPPETKGLIQTILFVSSDESTFLKTLQEYRSWNVSKCELFHWSEVLNKFDDVLAAATETSDWMLACDVPASKDATLKRQMVREVLRFTSMLIEHSFSRHLYNSMDRLIALLSSSDMNIVQSVLSLLYTFSKRSSYLTRLREDQTKSLFLRLHLLAETWGGKVNGFGLAESCQDLPLSKFPASATTVHFEFFAEQGTDDDSGTKRSVTSVIHVENVDKMKPKTVPEIMSDFIRDYDVPEAKLVAKSSPKVGPKKNQIFYRLHCVHSRLLALAILAYTCHIPENVSSYIYSGLVEELVDVLQLSSPALLDLKSAVMRTLTAIVHHDRGARCLDIIDATSASSYHGFLPVLVRTCIQSLTENKRENFPAHYATAVFSFLYHMASYESGGGALVACGMMESMLKVVNWYDTTEENITFVTRAVRVIDLITNMDMQSFHNHNGLALFIKRLEHEVEICRKEQPHVIHVAQSQSEPTQSENVNGSNVASTSSEAEVVGPVVATPLKPATLEQCFAQRAALLKSILNFLKKIIPDPTFTDSIRHLMDGSLPNSLKHIISNAEYYGSSLFLLATDIVTVYVFHEPAMLSALQERGLPDVILQAVLLKDLPPTKEVLSAIPNICSALCLNARGLQAFVAYKPFEKLFQVLLSPEYLPAMRRRRTGEGYGDTASGLGSAVDELMRHQPTLRTQAMQDIVKLLHDLCALGRDPKCISVASGSLVPQTARTQRPDQSLPGDSDSEDEDFEDSQQGSTSFHSMPSGLQIDAAAQAGDIKEKTPVPLMDYIVHVTKFVEAVLTSNSTDDHCREFIRQEGLKPLMEIFRLPNLPLEFPYSHACHSTYTLVKSVVAYCRDHHVLEEAFSHMDVVLKEIKAFTKPVAEPGGSAMLNEWARSAPNIDDALRDPSKTPLIHRLSCIHSYVSMMCQICKLNQSDIRILCTNSWATDAGMRLLHEIADVYSFLLWENTILIALCSDEGLLPHESDISKADLKTILSYRKGATDDEKPVEGPAAGGTPMDVDDQPSTSVVKKPLITRQLVNVVKLLKPLITIATKLCRVIGELLSLMVKFCVNPTRPRRQAIGMRAGEVPSSNARTVATTIAGLMSQVINRKGPLTSPPARFRLNYMICVLTFIQPLMFDEKRFAFHYMLQKFISVGTINAFFGTFKAVMQGPTTEMEMARSNTEKSAISQFVVDFAVAFLTLLEKLLNPKNVMESPNTLPPSRIAIQGYAPFDPVPYYIEMLHSTLQVIDKLLSLQTLKSFGENTGDLLLTILSHVMKIEAVIKEKTPEVTPAAPSTETATTSGAVVARPVEAAIPPALQSLMDMGFSREAAAEALTYNGNNVEQAADYLLAVQPDRVLRTTGMRLMDVDDENNDDELMLQAIAMSIGENVDSSLTSTDPGSPPNPLTPPSPQQIDTLIDKALPLCIDLVDFAPECVFKVADLITVVSKRNGHEWRLKLIKTLAKDAVMFANHVIQAADAFYSGSASAPADASVVEIMRSSPESQKLSARLHLLCILIQENLDDCGQILDSDSLVPLLINLISAARRIYGLVSRGAELVPKWLAFAFLILDSYEKICASIKRKEIMSKHYTTAWKWLDVRAGKWTNYGELNNTEINEAYDKGLATCKLTSQGAGPARHYIVRFKDMVQVTDSSGSRRPIMRELQKREIASLSAAVDPLNIPALSDETAEPAVAGSLDTGSPMQTDQEPAEEKAASLELTGLVKEQKLLLINDAVGLIHQKLDPDTLQAAMRLLLRFTRDYEYAQHFAELKGPQILLSLDRRSSFDSFSSFLTHLIRHIIENAALLDNSMEKFCSWLTYGVVSTSASTSYNSNATREANYVMRISWPGAARNCEKFIECAKRVIRFNIPSGAPIRNAEDTGNRSDLVKPVPPKRNISIGKEQPEAYRSILKELVADLLNLLVQPYEPELRKPTDTKDPVKENGSSSATAERTTRSSSQQLQQLLQQPVEGTNAGTGSVDTEQATWKNSDKAKRPIISKSVSLRVLAELVKSYNHVAEYIMCHVYAEEQRLLVKEETAAVAFILDNFVHTSQKSGDEYCPYSARVLMASLASAFEHPLSQMQIVEEVKQALQRATILPESQEKHERISALANIIHTMVEACPVRVADPTGERPVQYVVNHMGRCMAKRNLVNDLAKIPHSLDLRSPHLASTINCILRPMEILTRLASSQDKLKTRPRHSSTNMPQANPSSTGNAEAVDLDNSALSTIEESQRTENDVAPIADDTLNMAEGADLHDLYFRTPSMDVDNDNQRNRSEEEDENEDLPLRRNNRRGELDVSMDDDNSENEEETGQRRSPGRITDDEPDEVDEDEEMQEDDDEEDEEEDEEEDDEEEDELVDPIPAADNGNGMLNNLYGAAFDGAEWDEEQNPDDDMLFHLEDLFPGATVHQHAGNRTLTIEQPLVFELNAVGPGAVGQELNNGGAAGRQLPPPLAISSSHPLLSRPPPSSDPGQPTPAGQSGRIGAGASDMSVNARGNRILRLRANQFARTLGAGRMNPPAILQRLLGPAFQLQPGDMLIRGGDQNGLARELRDQHRSLLWGDHDYSGTGRQADPDDLTLVDDPIFLGTSGVVATLPSLVKRWSEEARVLDGDNVIECADVTKPFILPEIEEIRDRALKEVKKSDTAEKMTDMTPDASRQSLQETAARVLAESVQGGAASSGGSIRASNLLDDIARIQETVNAQAEAVAAISQAVAARALEAAEDSESENSEDYSSHLSEDTDGDLQETVMQLTRQTQPAVPMESVEPSANEQFTASMSGETRSQPPAPPDTGSSRSDTVLSDGQNNLSTVAGVSGAGVSPPINETILPPTPGSGEGSADASLIPTIPGYPVGLDPSFLEALPENIRQEVIADFVRQQRLQRQNQARLAPQPATDVGASVGDAGVAGPSQPPPIQAQVEINPEFLAALPPNIQEEVLAQQRLEQARIAAQNAAPDAPFDPATFIQSLAPSLRRQILTDLDDTLLTVLTDPLAQEARNLRREREVEHRHVFGHGGLAFDGDVIAFMRGRFPTVRPRGGPPRTYPPNYAARGGGSTANRRQVGRMRLRTHNGGEAHWLSDAGLRPSAWSRAATGSSAEFSRTADIDSSLKASARPILDFEGLSCLLVLYFLNTPAINIGRVQRIFRNICHHAPTREWVFDAIMSMLKKADDSKTHESKRTYSTIKPNWLNVSIDAALGCRANVFQLLPKQVKKAQTAQSPLITIHPQAAQLVCANLLDCLMLMAKHFPEQFVPYAIKAAHVAGQVGEKSNSEGSALRQSKSPSRASSRSTSGVSGKPLQQDFWEILVKLDAQVGSGVKRTGRLSGKMNSPGPTNVVDLGQDEPLRMTDFVNSGLGQLIMMLLSDTFHKIPDLADRLLRLIASIAVNVYKRDLGLPIVNSATGKTGRVVIRPGRLNKKEKDLVVWKAAVTRYFSLDIVDPTVQPPVPIIETEGGDFTADSGEVAPLLTRFLAKLDPQADLYELKDQLSRMATELCNLSTPGAVKFTLSLEFEQSDEICGLLKELVDVLITRKCSEEGLEDITHTLIMLSQRLGSSVRQSVGQMLLDGIHHLATEVSTQIESLMREAASYNTIKSREKTEEVDDNNEGSVESSSKGIIADRFTSGESVVLFKSKGKSQGGPDVHLSGMTQLTGKSSSQTFMLKLLKVMIDLRGTARTSLRTKSSDKTEEAPNGTINSIARRLLEMSYGNRQRRASAAPSASSLSDPETPMEVDILATEEVPTTTTAKPVEGALSLAVPLPEAEVDLPPLSELLNVGCLWTYLSLCLTELEKTGDQNAVLILQPTVESFFLVHATEKRNADRRDSTTRAHPAGGQQDQSAPVEDLAPPSPAPGASGTLETSVSVIENVLPSTLPPDVRKFLQFAETHRVVLNQILRQSTFPLSEGPFAVLVDHTRVLDFDVKRKYFRHELERTDAHRMRREDLALRIRRANVFEDSFRDLHRRPAEDWKARFYIMFEGEEGQDAGGLLREWYSIISREIFNPMYALFRTSPGDRVTYMINSHSHINSNHLSYYKFVGRLIAKAVYDNKLLDCYFTRSFYKHILGKSVKYTDMESEDYAFYQGLVYLLTHSVEEMGSELSFSTEVQEFGVTEVRDLKPNGRNIPVSDETKQEYVRLACQMKMTQAVRKQLDSFLEGFYEVIPKRLISIFNEQELELLISGLPNIDIDDLKANTDYHKYQNSSLQIQWFWRAVRSFDQADRAKFLQFVTGTSKVPLNGFVALEGMSGAQKFQIHRDDRSTDRLPSAHTCFNQLDLPAYETYDKLRSMLTTAIHECSEGFGFA